MIPKSGSDPDHLVQFCSLPPQSEIIFFSSFQDVLESFIKPDHPGREYQLRMKIHLGTDMPGCVTGSD